MKIIPSFKPSISYRQLNRVLQRLLFGGIPEQAISVFEQEFARYLGVKYAIRVPFGRWGLYYILESLNLKKGDEVIIPAFTYFAVPAAIVKLGLKPVFVDIRHQSLNIDIQKIEENITDRTRVIIPTYLCGFACEIDEILEVAQKHNLFVIEDCAQSLGAEYKGKKLGSWGNAAYFTFGITKNFTTLGGGMIVTNNSELADSIRYAVRKIRTISKRVLFLKLLEGYIMKIIVSPIIFLAVYYVMRIFSYFEIDIVSRVFHEKEILLGNLPKSGQMNTIQAELGVMQLNDLDRENEMKIEKGLELYRRLKFINNVRIPLLVENAKNIFSGCPILVKNKKDMKTTLLKRGVDVSAGYIQDCSRLNIFKEFKKNCPNALGAEDSILYLPLYPELIDTELIYIVKTIKQIII